MQTKYGEKSFFRKKLVKYNALHAQVFQPIFLSIILIFYAICSYIIFISFGQQRKKILAYTDVTATTAVYVIPCKF